MKLPPPVVPKVPAAAAGEEAARARRRSVRGLCALFGCLGLVLLLPIIAAGLYLAEYYRCSRFTPTGDELFDRYARAVIQRRAPRLFVVTPAMQQGYTLSLGSLPDRIMAEWEGEFGDDPRYWQLRYNCGLEPVGETTSQGRVAQRTAKRRYLETARERGIADAATLRLLLEDYEGEWKAEQAPSTEASEPEKSPQQVDRLAADRELCLKRGEELETLLDEMVSAAPNCSYPYYRRAIYHWLIGGTAQALDDFRRGNSAEDNSMPVSFPYSVSITLAEQDAYPFDEPVFCANALASWDEPLEDYPLWRAVGYDIVAQTQGLGNRRLLAEFHRFCCRLGTMQGSSDIGEMCAPTMARRCARLFIVDFGADITRDERDALLRVVDSAHHLRLEFHATDRGMSVAIEQETEKKRLIDRILDSDSDTTTGAKLEYWARELMKSYPSRYARRARYFERLATFDYVTLSWPEEEDAEAPASADGS